MLGDDVWDGENDDGLDATLKVRITVKVKVRVRVKVKGRIRVKL